MTESITLSAGKRLLTLADLEAVARRGYKIEVDAECRPRIERARAHVERALADAREAEKAGEPIPALYGVTTGFGEHKHYLVRPEDAHQLQANILRSHAIGVGERLPYDVVRAIGLLRLATFVQGRSGVRYELIERIRDMINADIVPIIPAQGSLGASGDLCPLAHWALVLIGEGQALVDGVVYPGTMALKRAKMPPLFALSYKEGLALTNGTAASTAIAALATIDAINLIKHADIAAVCSAEAVGAPTRAYDHIVHAARPHPGQISSAANFRQLLAGSEWVNTSDEIQESYSIRCTPQVHGASADAIGFTRSVVEREINSVTDNPLFFVEDDDPPPSDDGRVSRYRDYSAGNFHGQPVALAVDFLGLAIAELGNIAERRIQKLLDAHHNAGLPASLSTRPGLQSGLMIAQYTAAALVSENKTLCHPASCDSIPTSANIEDHVSMSMTGARQAAQILTHVESVNAIELLCAYQAQCFRRGILSLPAEMLPLERLRPDPARKFGPASQAVFDVFQETEIKPVKTDRSLSGELVTIRSLIRDGVILRRIEEKTGQFIYELL
jgi:histidine ammonia-lyase